MDPTFLRSFTDYATEPLPRRGSTALLTLSATALDALHEAIAFYDQAGRPQAVNRAMQSALTSPAIQREVLGFRDALLQRAALRMHLHEHELLTREFVYRTRALHLRGAVLGPPHCIPGPSVCVALLEGARVVPNETDLRARFHLTPREACIALRIAEGLSNREIAERLRVSPHTIRHHVEHLFAKMCVESRAALAWELLRT